MSKFRASTIFVDGEVNPFAVLVRQLELLDLAAEVAHKDENFEQLLEVSERVGEVNADYINILIHLVLGEEEEEKEEEVDATQFGFTMGDGVGDTD